MLGVHEMRLKTSSYTSWVWRREMSIFSDDPFEDVPFGASGHPDRHTESHLQDITLIPMLAGADGIAKFARLSNFGFF
jgi:hypothetical protein